MDDLLPTSPKARAILSAVETLTAAGIVAVFEVDSISDETHRIALRSGAAPGELNAAVLELEIHRMRGLATTAVLNRAKRA